MVASKRSASKTLASADGSVSHPTVRITVGFPHALEMSERDQRETVERAAANMRIGAYLRTNRIAVVSLIAKAAGEKLTDAELILATDLLRDLGLTPEVIRAEIASREVNATTGGTP